MYFWLNTGYLFYCFLKVISACWGSNKLVPLIRWQGGITCGAIDEPRKSSKAIDKPVIIDFRDKNVVIARFRDKNGGFIDSHSDQSIAIFFY